MRSHSRKEWFILERGEGRNNLPFLYNFGELVAPLKPPYIVGLASLPLDATRLCTS
jgi:hypothetical protein